MPGSDGKSKCSYAFWFEAGRLWIVSENALPWTPSGGPPYGVEAPLRSLEKRGVAVEVPSRAHAEAQLLLVPSRAALQNLWELYGKGG